MKWLSKSYLAGIEHMKIAWVVRERQQKNTKKAKAHKHNYLLIDEERVSSLSKQIGFHFGEGLANAK